MKIGVVIERIETWRGGAETSAMELSQRLADRGHDVHVITATNSQSLPDISIHTMKRSPILRGRRSVTFAKEAAGFIGSQDFDIVHAISAIPQADVYQPRGGLLAETMARNVATRPTASRRLLKRALMAMNVKQRSLLDLERKIFRENGPVIAPVSEYVARQCREYYDLPEDRCRVVMNGVRLQTISPEQRVETRSQIRNEYKIAGDQLLLLFLAHNFRLKGLYPLLESLSRLLVSGFDRFHLMVVGRDNVVPFQKRTQALDLQDRVTFTGPTQRSTAFFLGGDVCVHPTYYDPCSRVVLEALSLGLPTITTAFNGASEVMRDGQEGFVIASPEDTGLWARRIEDLASADLRERMSLNAAKLRPTISMQRHVDELCALYNEICDRKQCGATSA